MSSKQCPFCKSWIPLPLRRSDAAFEKHKSQCDPVRYKAQVAYGHELIGGDAPDLLAPPEEMDDATRDAVRKAMIGEEPASVMVERLVGLADDEPPARVVDAVQEPTAPESSLTSPERGSPIGLYTIYLSEDDRERIGLYLGLKHPKKEDLREFAYEAIAKAIRSIE